MGAVNTTNGTYYIDDYTSKLLLAALVQPLDENEYKTTRLVFSTILTTIFSSFGLVTNLINIAVFYRQGILSESCTPTLVAMTVSDLFLNCTTLAEAACYVLSETGHRLLAMNKYMLYASQIALAFPMFTLFTCFTTAYLAFERMISVTFPFRVRELFSPRRSALANLIIMCVLFILHIPKLFPNTVVVASFLKNLAVKDGFIPQAVDDVLDIVNDMALRLAAVLLVTICNIIVGIKVNTSEKFRKAKKFGTSKMVKAVESTKTNSDPKRTATTTTKEIKVIRMMFVLSLMLFVCYFPGVYQSLKPIGAMTIMFDASYSFELISRFLQVVNSSCNIIVYYIMSSKYRKELTVMCSCHKTRHAIGSKNA